MHRLSLHLSGLVATADRVFRRISKRSFTLSARWVTRPKCRRQPNPQRGVPFEHVGQVCFETASSSRPGINDALDGGPTVFITGWKRLRCPNFDAMMRIVRLTAIFDARNRYDLKQLKGAGIQLWRGAGPDSAWREIKTTGERTVLAGSSKRDGQRRRNLVRHRAASRQQ